MYYLKVYESQDTWLIRNLKSGDTESFWMQSVVPKERKLVLGIFEQPHSCGGNFNDFFEILQPHQPV